MDQLVGLLGRERRLLEVLLYKLVSARHLLAAGDVRFLPWAAAEVERAVERVREGELLRATIVNELARDLGVAEDRLTLRALADESVEPYRSVFEDHRRAFLELVNEIQQVSAANRRLAGKGMQQVGEVLSMIEAREHGPDVQAYGPGAHRRPSSAAPVRLDTAL